MERKKVKTITTNEEKALYSKLCRILDNYRFERINFDPLGEVEIRSGKDAANRALNVLNKCSSSRRAEVLKKVIDDVEASIASRRSTKDVFYSVEEVTKKYLNSVKTSKNNQDTKKDLVDPYMDNDLINKINTSYDERFDNRNLVLIECTRLNKQIGGVYNKLIDLVDVGVKAPAGPQEVYSEIYRGFFNSNKQGIIDDLVKAGYNVKKNAKLVDFMNNDLLKYYEICLSLVLRKCEEYYTNLKDGTVKKADLDRLCSDIVRLSRNVKKAYSNRFGSTPKEAFVVDPHIPIRDDVDGAQMTLGDILPEEEKEEIIESMIANRQKPNKIENNENVLKGKSNKRRGR